MGVIERHSILTGFKVGEAMRRQVLKLPETDSIKKMVSPYLSNIRQVHSLLLTRMKNPAELFQKQI